MRRVLIGDVLTVARVLHALPAAARPLRLARLIGAAEAADEYRKETGRAHPIWGVGTLEGAASGMPRGTAEDFDDIEFCRCWILVLEALVRRGSARALPD